VIALLRYQAAILVRSNRWIFPLIAYAILILTGVAGGKPAGPPWLPLADGLDWSAAMLIPVVAFLTRSMLVAEPDASRACVAAATSTVRAQLAVLLAALGGGLLLAVAGSCFEVISNPPVDGVAGGFLGNVGAAIFALASDVSPAGAALRHASTGQSPHWPGAADALGAACLLVVTWSASVLAATRRDTRSAASG